MDIGFLMDVVQTIYDAFHDQSGFIFGVDGPIIGPFKVFKTQLMLPEFKRVFKLK